jgi:hypothetical protein
LVVVILLIVGVGLVAGGEPGRFVTMGIQYVPFILLAFIGVLGKRHTWARWVSYGYALLLQGLLAYFTFSYVLLGLAEGSTVQAMPDGSTVNVPDLPPDALLPLLAILALLGVFFLVCSAVLLRPVRSWLTRWLPIDPDNYTHTIALWVVLYITTTAYAQLALLGGEPPLLSAINTGAISTEALGERSELGQSLDLIYGLIWMLPLAFAAAGWPLQRSLGTALQRLGLVRPTWRQVAAGVVAAVALAFAMGYVEQGINTVWNWFGWPETDAAAFEALLGALVSPLGAVVIGFTAGVGEELAVRGLLQPRLGLLLSNLAFTSIHAYQYSFDALLVVFTLGLVLGLIRDRTNTSTAAIVHGGYNTVSVLLSL